MLNRLTLLVLAGALLLVAIVSFRRRREEMAMPRTEVPPPAGDDDIDWDALERAEREVQELDHDGSGGAPDQAPGEDWGPGTPKPPLA